MTDTFGQLVDRITVARLKAYHHRLAGRTPAADVCDAEAELLGAEVDVLLEGLVAGETVPLIKPNTRFHNHLQVEGHTLERPSTVGEVLRRLVTCHADYWGHQTIINQDKAELVLLEAQGSKEVEQMHGIAWRMTGHQRECDALNEERNQLIQWADELLLKVVRR